MDKTFIKWSQKEFKYLPWRKERSLYGTLVSEIMLQQTTVATVVNHYERFLKVFPTVESLAKASEEEVCAHWQGLGYYRRARNLRKAALAIVEEHQGEFPKTIEELKKIPGIGDYTAGALVSIGMNKRALAIDANLERVLARLFGVTIEKGPKLIKELYKKFEANEFENLFKTGKPRELNEALMDVGRVYCQARRADCHLCPLKKDCWVVQNKQDALKIPVQKTLMKPQEKNLELELLRIIVKGKGKVLGQVKGPGEWLTGQVEIPTFILKSEDKGLKQYPVLPSKAKKELKDYQDLPVVKTAITKYKIKNYLLTLSDKQFQELIEDMQVHPEYKYFKFDVQNIHFSTTTLKSFRKLGLEV